MVELIGYFAGLLAMISFLPQVIKTLQTKSSNDISLTMLLFTFATNILYLIYGIFLSLKPIVIMISIMTMIVVFQIYLTLKYRVNNNSR